MSLTHSFDVNNLIVVVEMKTSSLEFFFSAFSHSSKKRTRVHGVATMADSVDLTWYVGAADKAGPNCRC